MTLLPVLLLGDRTVPARRQAERPEGGDTSGSAAALWHMLRQTRPRLHCLQQNTLSAAEADSAGMTASLTRGNVREAALQHVSSAIYQTGLLGVIMALFCSHC